MSLQESVDLVANFQGKSLTNEIWRHEYALAGAGRNQAIEFCNRTDINESLLKAALTVKHAASQINVVIHALGILAALPKILREDELIESLSLGAGNTGKEFDLETSHRVAEFKFIEWQGADTIRQNSLFKDFFTLAESTTAKRRELYVTDPTLPLKFLCGRRSLKSVLSKNRAVSDRFEDIYGDSHSVVSDYYNAKKHLVSLIDLRTILPAFSSE